MHVIVVGAGIIGVCSAWFLRERGFEVTVVDRRSGVAMETSFGNAGIVAPGYVTPWAAPGMPGKVLSTLFAAEAPVVFRPNSSPALWRWLGRWLRECDLARYRRNKSRMQRIAFYSRAQLTELRTRLGIEYERSPGYMQLLRTTRDVTMAGPARAMLDEGNVPYRWLDGDEARVIEPALSPACPLAGALLLPEDESGNCRLFAQVLKERALAAGVVFRFDEPVRALALERGRVNGVITARGLLAADAVVVAAACDSVPLLRRAGIRLPLYPIKGYSATVTLSGDGAAPSRSVMDEAYKVAVTPMGTRLRIAGTAEIGSRELALRDSALRTLIKVAGDWFPGAARYAEATWWTGARPMLPDGAPVIGRTGTPGLFINVGHGSTGWAMACGSGRVLADIMADREVEIDLDGLTLERYPRRIRGR